MHHKGQQQLDVPYVLPPQMIFSNSKEFINMKKLLFAARLRGLFLRLTIFIQIL